jgi:SAM-dependent methyltransferase
MKKDAQLKEVSTYEIDTGYFVCPVTKGPLIQKNDELVSPGTGSSYDNKAGFWNFIPKKLDVLNNEIWKVWQQLQDNGVVAYENNPVANLGIGPRKDFISFGEFCNYKGLILDIGVGPQELPTHFEYVKSQHPYQFIGLDPLVGQQPRKFAFVQGLGEYLPFREKLFDQVLYATSLDHFINPVETLLEAKRVLKNGGEICIWIGEKDKNTPKPNESPDWYQKLEIPEGAQDPFHFKRFTTDEFRKYVTEAGLKISEEKEMKVDQWRKNIFCKLGKI